MCPEDCLVDIVWVHAYLVVTAAEVELGEEHQHHIAHPTTR
jgi:hypothetical protein